MYSKLAAVFGATGVEIVPLTTLFRQAPKALEEMWREDTETCKPAM